MSTSNPRVEAVRLDANRVRIETSSGLDVTLFANERVPPNGRRADRQGRDEDRHSPRCHYDWPSNYVSKESGTIIVLLQLGAVS